jgi:uncharacterized protein YdhG (YjbR/CyaY superfamily)
MKNSKITYSTIDEYIRTFQGDIRKILFELKKVIKTAAPESTEGISYRMPSFYFKGPVVYFAAFKNHVGLYATPIANRVFKKELSVYTTGKGSIQFPIDKPLPLKLISRIVKFKVRENIKKDAEKVKKGME